MIKSISFISSLFILSSFSTSCNSTSDYSTIENVDSKPATVQELKQQLLEKECLNGIEYLDGVLKFSPIYKNKLSSKVKGLKLSCNITNKATLATIKDIKAKVIFESKTGAKVLEKDFDIYEYISPNSAFLYKTELEITNQQYKDISSCKWTIVNASCK